MFSCGTRGFVIVLSIFTTIDNCYSLFYRGHSSYHNCDSYTNDEGGNTIFCPNTMRFNQELQACDLQQNVNNDCSGVSSTTLATTTKESEDYPLPPVLNNTSCKGVRLGYLLHPSDCSRFLLCYQEEAWYLDCPRGLHFDKDIKRCTSTTPSQCVLDPRCRMDIDFFPYPRDCAKYIQCYFNVSLIHSCPQGRWFHPEKKICSEPGDSNCVVTEPSWITQTFECHKPIAKSDNCRSYIICTNGTGVEKSCPDGLAYDTGKQFCSAQALRRCQGNRFVFPGSSIQPTKVPVALSYWHTSCASYETFLPHPVNKSMFLECVGNLAFERNCPEGLHFHIEIESRYPIRGSFLHICKSS